MTAAAWSDMMNATLPEALEQVAKDHANVPRAAMMSLIAAGDLRLRQLQSGVLSAAEGTTAAVVLDDAARARADSAAQEVSITRDGRELNLAVAATRLQGAGGFEGTVHDGVN